MFNKSRLKQSLEEYKIKSIKFKMLKLVEQTSNIHKKKKKKMEIFKFMNY
jgi:hypothetical protein